MKKIIDKLKSFFTGKIFISINKEKKDRKEKKPKIVKKKNIWGIVSVVVLSIISIGTGTTLGILDAKKNNNSIDVGKEVVDNRNKINRRLFLLSSDKLTVPVTVSIEKKSSLHEELKDIFDLLKENSPFGNDYLNGYINNDVRVNSIVLENKILTLDVNEKILETKYDINKSFEGLNQSFLQYEEIERVNVTINGKQISDFDEAKNVSSILETKSINDNNYYLSKRLGQKEIVFYERSYNDKLKYIVPMTVYVDETNNQSQAFVNATKVNQPLSSKLKKMSLYNALECEQNNEDYSFSINNNALGSDGLVSKELYDLVSLSFDFMNISKPVSFILKDTVIAVSGVVKDEVVPVSSIVYNELKI